MTSLACEPTAAVRLRPGRLVTAQFARLLLVIFGSGLSMYLLTSVVPLYLAASGAVALVAEVTPAARRREALGVYGVVVGLPAALGLPLGVYLTGVVGFETLFVLAAVSSLAGLAVLPGGPACVTDEEHHVKVLGGLRGSGLLMPAGVFAAVTLAAGISVTFLPLASQDHKLVAAALLVQAVTAPGARWVAGWLGDRIGPRRLLVPALALAALGAGALAFVGTPAAVLGGAALFGIGFGAAQNLTLAIMYDRSPRSRYGQVSALWNLAYDGGWGTGAILFGFVVAGIGYPTAFALTAAIVALAIGPAVRGVKSA
ncbi:MFS transporter [Kribbella sp. DT2]|uniref:MFS transporter n=1 Tax=Kribbella sp. DT2 TaxID=3393427 RepID=UPI003CF85724